MYNEVHTVPGSFNNGDICELGMDLLSLRWGAAELTAYAPFQTPSEGFTGQTSPLELFQDPKLALGPGVN